MTELASSLQINIGKLREQCLKLGYFLHYEEFDFLPEGSSCRHAALIMPEAEYWGAIDTLRSVNDRLHTEEASFTSKELQPSPEHISITALPAEILESDRRYVRGASADEVLGRAAMLSVPYSLDLSGLDNYTAAEN